MFRRKISRWSKLAAGAAAMKRLPRMPLVGVAVAAVGGTLAYRYFRRRRQDEDEELPRTTH